MAHGAVDVPQPSAQGPEQSQRPAPTRVLVTGNERSSQRPAPPVRVGDTARGHGGVTGVPGQPLPAGTKGTAPIPCWSSSHKGDLVITGKSTDERCLLKCRWRKCLPGWEPGASRAGAGGRLQRPREAQLGAQRVLHELQRTKLPEPPGQRNRRDLQRGLLSQQKPVTAAPGAGVLCPRVDPHKSYWLPPQTRAPPA